MEKSTQTQSYGGEYSRQFSPEKKTEKTVKSSTKREGFGAKLGYFKDLHVGKCFPHTAMSSSPKSSVRKGKIFVFFSRRSKSLRIEFICFVINVRESVGGEKQGDKRRKWENSKAFREKNRKNWPSRESRGSCHNGAFWNSVFFSFLSIHTKKGRG